MRRRAVLMTGLAASVVRAARGAPSEAVPYRVVPSRAVPSEAVLELFTSQGCSSCPPADALLGQLAVEPGIVALAWHVDYWNGLGWHDPYSSPAATARQRHYAEALRDEVYTPAMVVNGARMVVGSDNGAVRTAIGTAGGLPVPVVLRRDTQGWVAEIGAAGQPVNALLATYEPQHATAVGAGENGGRRLMDYRIVRDSRALGTWDGAARRLMLPDVAAGLGVALLVQSVDLKMLGAAELPPVGSAS
jgi:hypothetical protein